MEKKFYFITGLPRSRTAWIANLLTHGNSFCFHEALNFSNSISHFIQILEQKDYQFVGNSDPELGRIFETLVTQIKNWKLVIIERNFDSVYKSMDFFHPCVREALILYKYRLERIKKFEHLSIDFDDLDIYDNCEKICEYIGIEKLDQDRFDMLNALEVKYISPYNNTQATRKFKFSNDSIGRRGKNLEMNTLMKLKGIELGGQEDIKLWGKKEDYLNGCPNRIFEFEPDQFISTYGGDFTK